MIYVLMYFLIGLLCFSVVTIYDYYYYNSYTVLDAIQLLLICVFIWPVAIVGIFIYLYEESDLKFKIEKIGNKKLFERKKNE